MRGEGRGGCREDPRAWALQGQETAENNPSPGGPEMQCLEGSGNQGTDPTKCLQLWDSNTSPPCSLTNLFTLEQEMATQSGILVWRIPWTEEPGGLQSMGSQRVEHLLSLHTVYKAPRKLVWRLVHQCGSGDGGGD